jgi:hypothetical protein
MHMTKDEPRLFIVHLLLVDFDVGPVHPLECQCTLSHKEHHAHQTRQVYDIPRSYFKDALCLLSDGIEKYSMVINNIESVLTTVLAMTWNSHQAQECISTVKDSDKWGTSIV